MEKLIMYLVNHLGLGVTSLNAILGTLMSSLSSTVSILSCSVDDKPGGCEIESTLLLETSTISSALSIENVQEDLKDVDTTTAYIESLSTEDLDNLIANLSSDIELNEEEELTRKLIKKS
jgi:hypothetical protein